ncbi:MAG: phosphotriesterase [Acidimicrobiia bacterium]|nr:phosphotriesterase [Acidimicrobiia bacterium]
MRRREFLAALAALPARALADSILVHEHVLVDFIGADKITTGRYDAGEVFRAAKPKLEEVAALGCRRLQECTPNFLGRDPALLKRLSEAVGIDIWTNTGLYGARNHVFLPEYAKRETADQLARRWIEEWRKGVDGVKPRFIKIGVNRAPLHELDRKLIRAAALCSRETGLTIASHTGDGGAALEQVEVVVEAKVAASRFVWVHAQSEKDHAIHEKVARLGTWVEFDGISPRSKEWHVECVRFMAGKGLLSRTLISQDAGWYHVGEPGGGNYRGYGYVYTDFLPALEENWRGQLMRENPAQAFGKG